MKYDRSEAETSPRCLGKITSENFLRQFPFRSHFSVEEMNTILKRYSDDEGMVNFQALNDDVSEYPHNKPELQTSRDSPVTEHLEWSQDDISAVERLQARIVERQNYPRPYFHDFDPLRKGYCTVGQARTVFSILNLNASEEDFSSLCNLFCKPEDPGMFHYDAFQATVDEAFTMKGLEMLPLERPAPVSAESTLATRINCVKLTQDQLERIAVLEDRVCGRLKETRLPIRDLFKDFDRSHQSHVTNSQFARVLSLLQLPITSDDIELMAWKYCDRGNITDVNYMDFINLVDPPDFQPPEQSLAYSPYFDKNGDIIPAETNCFL